MSNAKEGQEQLIEVDGKQITMAELQAGYMKGSNYTQKSQVLAKAVGDFNASRADFADKQAQLNLINSQPGAKALFDHLVKHPEAIGQMLSPGQPQTLQLPVEPADPFGTAPAPTGQPQANPQLQAQLAAIAGVTEGLAQRMSQRERLQAVNAVSAELAQSYSDKTWLDTDLVLAEINASPDLWSLTAEQQVTTIVNRHYGNRLLEDAKAEGRADAQREYAAQLEAEEQAANTPTAATMPDGSAIPTDPRALQALMNTDPVKYEEAMQAIAGTLKAAGAENDAFAEALAAS